MRLDRGGNTALYYTAEEAQQQQQAPEAQDLWTGWQSSLDEQRGSQPAAAQPAEGAQQVPVAPQFEEPQPEPQTCQTQQEPRVRSGERKVGFGNYANCTYDEVLFHDKVWCDKVVAYVLDQPHMEPKAVPLAVFILHRQMLGRE